MFINYKKLLLCVAMAGMLSAGCNKWDDHNAITDAAVTKDLLTQIKENKDLSKFAGLLTKTGYDQTIASSKTYTVFAPTNAALAALDPAIENDAPKLRLFVANHIANQLFPTSAATSQLRIRMLSDKYNNMLGSSIEEAQITDGNHYAKNGILHIVNKNVPALESAWEFLENNTLAPSKQKAYLLSLYLNVFDTSNAVVIGVDPNTGKPLYQAGTDSVRSNSFWRSVYDLHDESKQYTFFMLSDNAWDGEITKFSPYHATSSADSSANFSKWTIVKDFAVEGVYSPASIPDTLVSKFNVKVGIDKSAIVQTIKTSNGIVYIMNKLDVLPRHKFQQVVIEAENYSIQSPSKRSNTYFRDRFNPLTGKDFRDVLVYNHGTALLNMAYRVTNMPTMKFKAYWVALHDNLNNATTSFTQKLGVGIPTSTVLPYITVTVNNYAEVPLGEFTLTQFSTSMYFYLTAANSTSAPANNIVCDYIRLEPVF